jgi:hypothetical protein
LSNFFQSIWDVNIVPLKTVAAIKQGEEVPSPINALGLENRDFIKFEIPVYQRGLVWTKKKRTDFLDSIRKGWPTGSIVLTRLGQTDGLAGPLITWHVLDGQQRISTFQHFRENFWREPWYDFTKEMKENLKKWAELVSKINNVPTLSPEDLEAAIQLLTTGDELHKFKEEYLDETLVFINRLSLASGGSVYAPSPQDLSESDYEALQSSIRFIRISLLEQKKALDEVPISLITITPMKGTSIGEAVASSAEIFERLNSGVALTRYELLNAKWMGYKINWLEFASETDTLLKDFMFEKMSQRIKAAWENDGDFEFEASVEELTESEVTLFDYLYALSFVTRNKPSKASKEGIRSETRNAFPPGKSEEELAFDVASLVFSGSSDANSVDKLPERFPRVQSKSDTLEVTSFTNYYLEAVKILNKSLNNTLYSAQTQKKAQLGVIQASTYIASYLTGVYCVDRGHNNDRSIEMRKAETALTNDGNQRLTTQERRKLFERNIKSWFLFDSLDSVFQGNLANSESRIRVWPDFKSEKGSEFFLQQPLLSDLFEKLKSLFVTEFYVPSAPLRRNYVNSTLALFLTVYEELGNAIESHTIDHVIPWNKLSKQPFKPLPAPIPLNHPANFMPLEKRINSSRQNNSWSDYFSNLQAKDKANVKKALFILPELCTDNVRESLEEFAYFLMHRWIYFVDTALINISHFEYIEKTPELRKIDIANHLREIAKSLEPRIQVDQDRLNQIIDQIDLSES